MSTTIVPAERVAVTGSLPQFVRVPLLHCRHYVRNYFDLFLDLLGRIYSAGGVDDDIIVEPGNTFGDALSLTEQIVADALVQRDANGGESVLLSLIRTILTDEGVAQTDLDGSIQALESVLRNHAAPTFRQKANDLDFSLTGFSAAGIIPLTQDQVDKVIRAFRSIGKVIADLLAFEFPELEDYRQDLFTNPERYLLVTGPYRAVLSSDPSDVLTCSFANDRITIELRFKSLSIAESANFEFFKVKEKNNGKTVTKEKHELLMSALGSLVFRDVAIKLVLDDTLDPPEAYPWAPGQDVRRAQWTRPSVRIAVDAVDLDLHANAATVLLSFLEFYWGSVQKLEEDLEDAILDSVNAQAEIAGLGKITNTYVTPIAQVIIPVSHAISKVRIADPFEGLVLPNELDTIPPGLQRAASPRKVISHQWDPQSHIKFDGLKTVYESRAVSIRNLPPDPIEVESNPINEDDDVRFPDNLDDLDPASGTWAWPSQGGGLTQLDLENVDDRVFAIDVLEQTPNLSTRTRAIAALSVEGFSPGSIGALRGKDFDAKTGTVYGRAVGARTVALVEAAQLEGKSRGAGEFLFNYDDFTGSAALVEAELRSAQYRVIQFALTGGTGPVPQQEQVLVPNFDPDIWDMKYQDRTPLKTSRGSPSDPGWIGLSTNCVVATTLYRKLQYQNWFKRSGETRNAQEKISYELHDCVDVAADFSGDAPGDAPALAIHELKIAVGTARDGLTEYTVDLRLRLMPQIYGRGCLPDDAVTYVSDSLQCIEDLTKGKVPTVTRLRQIDFRDFIFLRADFEDEQRDIQVVNISDENGNLPPDVHAVEARVRAAIAHWFPTVPEPPILYNAFRPVGGASRNFTAEKGWLSFYRRYAFPDFSDVDV